MKQLSLNKKIVGLIAIFFMANVITSYFGISRVTTINNSLSTLVNITADRLLLAKTMDSLVNKIRNYEKVFILEETAEGMAKTGAMLDKFESDIKQHLESYKKIASSAGKADIATLEIKLAEWKKVSTELRAFALIDKNKEAVDIARGSSRITMEQFGVVLESIVTRNEKAMQTEAKLTNELVSSTRLMILAISAVALSIGSILAYFVMKALSKTIDEVIGNLNDSSQQVASAAGQIASSSEELSQATTEQAASLEQTAASVEEMSSMINKNSDNAKNASENSKISQNNALKGKETVNEMIRSIDEINQSNNKIMEQINHSNNQFSDIVKVISEIENKTKVINDIVFQTKLLSFNASVEAARAGEHGKGFAVVAEEVGNLAQMSGNAAKEISSMLEESIRKVESIVNETKSSVDKLIAEGKSKVDNGTKIAQNCGDVLEEIVQSISKVTSMAEEISTASHEQAQGISEITKAMHQLDQVTQQNAATSEEAASSAEELSVQADMLKSAVVVLVTTIKGTSEHTPVQAQNVKTRTPTTKAATIASTKASTLVSTKTNVISLKNKSADKKPMKIAVGSTYETSSGNDKAPAYDDARFKDV